MRSRGMRDTPRRESPQHFWMKGMRYGSRKASLKRSGEMEKSKGWIEVVITNNHAFGMFVLLVVFLAVVACLLGLAFGRIFKLESAGKVEISSFSITYRDENFARVFAIIHANQMLPQDGISIKENATITVSASGEISTSRGLKFKSIMWDGTNFISFKKLIKEKIKLPDSIPMNEESLIDNSHNYYYRIMHNVLRTEHESDINLQGRGPDGMYVCGINEMLEKETSGFQGKCSDAKIKPELDWGYLLGTIASDKYNAYKNIINQIYLNESIKDKYTSNSGWVFPIGKKQSLYIKNKVVYDSDSKQKLAKYECDDPDNPKIYLFINDVFLTKGLLDNLISISRSSNDLTLAEEFEYQAALLTANAKYPNTFRSSIDWNMTLNGLWYLNNSGMLTVDIKYVDKR